VKTSNDLRLFTILHQNSKMSHMKRQIVLTILFVEALWSTTNAQDYKMGLRFNIKAYNAMPSVPKTRDLATLPTAFSLKQYCPTPGNQQNQGSCVAWAMSYGARTIMAAVRGNMTDPKDIAAEALSPSFVFNQIMQEQSCTNGSEYIKGIAVLYQQGCDQLKNYPYDCNPQIPDAASKERAAAFKISEAFRLSNENSPLLQMMLVKRAITNKKPVLIGVDCYRSFERSNRQKFWTGEQDTLLGGHAMVVVGYDDKVTEGGAFLLLNSWGTKWGEGGFIWVRYKDLMSITKEYYIMEDVPTRLKKSDKPQPSPVSTEQKQLSGAFKLVTDGLYEMPGVMGNNVTRDLKVVSNEPTYRLTKPYPSGTQFRIYMTNQVPAYVYILGYGTVTKHVEILFPYEGSSPYFPFVGSELALPDTDSWVTLDENVGRDYLCTLYSTEPLDIAAIREAIENAPQATFSAKLKSVLKNKLATNVQFDKNSIAFKATVSGSASVVPIIVEVEHIK
jgi:Papain family cysteine protease/Domain of unknown function (DUF4384)